jgi:hypothetical protein
MHLVADHKLSANLAVGLAVGVGEDGVVLTAVRSAKSTRRRRLRSYMVVVVVRRGVAVECECGSEVER